MKIIQIGPYPLNAMLIRGGVESSVSGLAQEQGKQNEVIVMDTPRKDVHDALEKAGNVSVYRFQNRGRHQIDARKRIPDVIKAIQAENPAICHIHGTDVYRRDLLKALSTLGIPVIVTVHGLLCVEKKKELKRHFSLKTLFQLLVQASSERHVLKTVGKAIVDTHYVADTIRTYPLKNYPQMVIIPQGINDRFFHMSCSYSSQNILSVGAFARRKGHMLLIQAFELVCKLNSFAFLTICGSQADSQYLNDIKSYVSKSPFGDRIRLVIDGSQEVLDELYKGAHIFALHSQEESQGIVLAEAMAIGLPVVSTRVGGIPYVIEDGQTGLLSEYGDVPSFANAMLSLLNDRDYWALLSKQSRIVAAKYSWASIAEQISHVYHDNH